MHRFTDTILLLQYCFTLLEQELGYGQRFNLTHISEGSGLKIRQSHWLEELTRETPPSKSLYKSKCLYFEAVKGERKDSAASCSPTQRYTPNDLARSYMTAFLKCFTLSQKWQPEDQVFHTTSLGTLFQMIVTTWQLILTLNGLWEINKCEPFECGNKTVLFAKKCLMRFWY